MGIRAILLELRDVWGCVTFSFRARTRLTRSCSGLFTRPVELVCDRRKRRLSRALQGASNYSPPSCLLVFYCRVFESRNFFHRSLKRSFSFRFVLPVS